MSNCLTGVKNRFTHTFRLLFSSIQYGIPVIFDFLVELRRTAGNSPVYRSVPVITGGASQSFKVFRRGNVGRYCVAGEERKREFSCNYSNYINPTLTLLSPLLR